MTATLTGVPIPKTSDELAEMINDKERMASVLSDKATFAAWIDAYAQARQGDGTDLHRIVAEETQRQFAEYMKANADMDRAKANSEMRRLNLDPQLRPATMLTSHRQATAHNPKAPGAILDGEFTNAAEYFKQAWHLNSDIEAREKMARIRNSYSSVVPADGGFLVPETLRSQLLQIALEQSVVRARATVVPMETARVPFPLIDTTTHVGSVFGGLAGYWGEESALLTESSPKFGRIVLDAKKLTGFAAVPNELIADSIISFAALIETLWPQALAFFEDLAFIGGSGVGEPEGFLGNPAVAVVSKETGQASGTILAENIDKMYSRMLPASLARAVWICSPDCLPQLFSMARSVGTGGSAVMITNMASTAPGTIYGRPLIVSEKAKALGTQGDIAFADLSYYLVGDRQTMSASSSTEYKFGSDQTAFRIIQRVDGRPWIQSAITPANGGSTLSPFVELASR